MTQDSAADLFVAAALDVLREAVEGGRPGEGTMFLDGTAADGSRNHGLLATLDALSAQQASDPGPLGVSVAGHAAHVAYHLEVCVRWENGERGPFDWKGSFEPGAVDAAQWADLRARVRRAYDGLRGWAGEHRAWTEDNAGMVTSAAAHVAYHLGALRQAVKRLA